MRNRFEPGAMRSFLKDVGTRKTRRTASAPLFRFGAVWIFQSTVRLPSCNTFPSTHKMPRIFSVESELVAKGKETKEEKESLFEAECDILADDD